MPSIFKHIANATNELDGFIGIIDLAFIKAVAIVEPELNADKIDVFVISAPKQTIPEYGIGGYTPGPNHCYIYLDTSSEKFTEEGLIETLLHEIHHCMRWRQQEYGITLGEALVSEGLACMYEEMHRGSPPDYAIQELSDVTVQEATDEIYNSEYDHDKWFFGTGDVPRWFGYTYGYTACKKYAEKNKKTAVDLIGIKAKLIFPELNTELL